MTGLRILFVKESQNWPRASGNDVHAYYLIKELAARGHAISLATIVPPTAAALEGLPLASLHRLDAPATASLPLSRLQRRLASYYGVSDSPGLALTALLREREFDVVVLVSRHLLPMLCPGDRGPQTCDRDPKGPEETTAGKRGELIAADPTLQAPRPSPHAPTRIWYPADDPTWHHLTRVKLLHPGTWVQLVHAAINVVFERAYRPCYDRVWVVTPGERRAVRVFSGCRNVDVIPNGVDAEHYLPGAAPDLPYSCVFWGRLDFDPNVDALEWFLGSVWPRVKQRTPSARFDVFGFNPRPRVLELARKTMGVEVHADLPDLRAEVMRRPVAVLPFVSGGGIKNKLLEAAAMGMPIVCTRWALSGTKGRPAVRVCRSASRWAEELARLWNDAEERRTLGIAAREWVKEHHAWDAAARMAEQAIAGTPS